MDRESEVAHTLESCVVSASSRYRTAHAFCRRSLKRLPLSHLHYGVHWASLLAEATVDAFGHVDVVTSRPPAAVRAWLRLNGDGLEGGHQGECQRVGWGWTFVSTGLGV